MNENELVFIKIKELEEENQKLKEENQKLKAMMPKERVPFHALCPQEIAEKYGGFIKGGARECHHFPFMHSDDLTALSRIIRRSCFLRAKKSAMHTNKKVSNFGCGKVLKDLTDEEYAKYCEVLDKCLAIFKEYGNAENDNW